MTTNKEISIVEDVRALKESNAAKYDFDVSKIIDAARKRQESSGRTIIRQVVNPLGGQQPISVGSDAG